MDNTGVITEKYMDGESLRVRMQAPSDLAPYIIKKGYISIDGTSLTITEADPVTGIFAVMLVPHTQRCIVLPRRKVGDRVNLGVFSADRRVILPSTAYSLTRASLGCCFSEVDIMTKAAMQSASSSPAQLSTPDAGGVLCSLCALGLAALVGWSLSRSISLHK